MGLDMYLSAKKYLSPFNEVDKDSIKTIDKMFGVDTDFQNDCYASGIEFSVCYWRKANAIHQWFVNNVQDGVDDCKEYCVSREQLESLVEDCKKVLESRSVDVAEAILPSQHGFFFGTTEYDDWYFDNVEYTHARIEKLLNDSAFANASFYYLASW